MEISLHDQEPQDISNLPIPTDEVSGSHRPPEREQYEAFESAAAHSSLPRVYEPYIRHYHYLVPTLQLFEEAAGRNAPRSRKVAKFIGNSTYLKNIAPLFGYFWLSWKTAHGATMLLADLALITYALVFVSGSQAVGNHEFSTAQIADWIGVLLYIQVVLPFTTWILGYIGPRESTYTAHSIIAGVRAVSCLGCFVQVYFRKDFGVLHPTAIKLVSVLVLASLAHLTGACIRTAHFVHERAQALSNPSDRRIHQGNGFMISYLSLEDQEKRKAAARVRVGMREAYEETLGAYWHCPTPELEVRQGIDADTQGIQWWQNMWWPRTLLQRHVERITYMRQWPLNFVTTAILRNDVFSRCDCCLDSDESPEPLVIHPMALEQLQHRREEFMRTAVHLSQGLPRQERPLSENGEQLPEWSADVMPDPPTRTSVPLHQLCERCLSMYCASELMTLFTGSAWSRFRWHVRATFAFTQNGPLLEEMFLLWESVVALRASAQNGCHLCSMLWDSISPTQQDALVREVNTYANTDGSNDLGVFVKILSPHGWQPGKVFPGNHLEHLYLVTHFGLRRVPRFWLEQKFVLRAQSLGRDPLLDHGELLPPIRICRTSTAPLFCHAKKY